jgi:hypothetical protein
MVLAPDGVLAQPKVGAEETGDPSGASAQQRDVQGDDSKQEQQHTRQNRK